MKKSYWIVAAMAAVLAACGNESEPASDAADGGEAVAPAKRQDWFIAAANPYAAEAGAAILKKRRLCG